MNGAVKLCSATVNRIDSVHKTWTAFTQEKAITFAYIVHIIPWREFQNKERIHKYQILILLNIYFTAKAVLKSLWLIELSPPLGEVVNLPNDTNIRTQICCKTIKHAQKQIELILCLK